LRIFDGRGHAGRHQVSLAKLGKAHLGFINCLIKFSDLRENLAQRRRRLVYDLKECANFE
jgi:hypothetical protein